jgi:hypothetical protein
MKNDSAPKFDRDCWRHRLPIFSPQSYSAYLHAKVTHEHFADAGWMSGMTRKSDGIMHQIIWVQWDDGCAGEGGASTRLRDRRQLLGSACSCSFVSPSVFSIRKGIKPVPKGVAASVKSDSYLLEGKGAI